MSSFTSPASPARIAEDLPEIDFRNLGWVALALAGMIAVILADNRFALNWLHVMAGLLWTGIDLFMGFVIGPILRKLPPEARRAMLLRLTPKTVFILPTLSIMTGTTGWYLAKHVGYLELAWPQFGWVVAALAILAVLTVQGLGYLLPTNIRVYLELRKDVPDGARIAALMSSYFYAVAFQGIMQIAMIVIMAKFVTGV